MALLFNKAFIIILAEYSNYNDIFLTKNIIKLSDYTEINNHAIKLKKDKQLFFDLIYSLKLMKLEILKTYIKTNLANYFIQLSKFLTKAFILFNRKLNISFYFYIDY